MGQHEYTVPLGAKPDEMKRVALAFRAGEQKERDRVRNALLLLEESALSHNELGLLVWTHKLINDIGVSEQDKVV
jgi:hypothetical protein